MCSNVSWCINKGQFSNRFGRVLDSEEMSDLDGLSKEILRNRYIKLINAMEVSSKRASFWFVALSTMTTVGSIIVPGLLSIQDRTFGANSTSQDKSEHENRIYWSTWGISLMVTLSNAFVRLFSFDKVSITRKLRTSHLKSEGWLFLELSGKYANKGTHQDVFQEFCTEIEKIRNQQIKEEYTFDSISAQNPVPEIVIGSEKKAQKDTMI